MDFSEDKLSSIGMCLYVCVWVGALVCGYSRGVSVPHLFRVFIALYCINVKYWSQYIGFMYMYIYVYIYIYIYIYYIYIHYNKKKTVH